MPFIDVCYSFLIFDFWSFVIKKKNHSVFRLFGLGLVWTVTIFKENNFNASVS